MECCVWVWRARSTDITIFHHIKKTSSHYVRNVKTNEMGTFNAKTYDKCFCIWIEWVSNIIIFQEINSLIYCVYSHLHLNSCKIAELDFWYNYYQDCKKCNVLFVIVLIVIWFGFSLSVFRSFQLNSSRISSPSQNNSVQIEFWKENRQIGIF